MEVTIIPLTDLIGAIPISIDCGDEEITIVTDRGTATFLHCQDCCEQVGIDDVNGDWNDLIGFPLFVAEERSNQEDVDYGSITWTFYTFRGLKGSVDVTWRGESNGYYSESVDYKWKASDEFHRLT
jgi:hypothetical protein